MIENRTFAPSNQLPQLSTIIEQLMQSETYYKALPMADYVGLILDGGERADEAMYYLLHQRLYWQLRKRFEVVQSQLLDDFDDVLVDFLFYLRDEKDSDGGNPYPSLRRIRNRETFGGWLLNTFRNYLSVRAAKEGRLSYSEHDFNDNVSDDTASSILTDEQKLSFAADLIAYVHQVMAPRESFIFFRTLLTLLNKQAALSSEAVAQALGMTDIAYRVSVHRMKGSLTKYRTRLLQGENLPLDEAHREMSRCINDDFTHLYPTLFHYYEQVIDTLDSAAAIRKLREEYLAATGTEAHEPETAYVTTLSKSALWNELTFLLIG